MAKFRSNAAPQAEGAERPTLAGLVKHAKTYGLEGETAGYRGVISRHNKYKALAKESLVEVGFDFLGVESYVQLVEALGYQSFADEARADWLKAHEDDEVSV